MGFLFASILVATGIFIAFRYFGIYRLNNENAIFINYLVAFLFGLAAVGKDLLSIPRGDLLWVILAVILGILFVVVFHIMARSTQLAGVSVSSVAGRMSVIIPMLFSMLYYREHISDIKIIALVLAPLSVLLVVIKKDTGKAQMRNILLPVLLFFGTGTIDSLVKFSQASLPADIAIMKFSTYLFLISAVSSYFTRSLYSGGRTNNITKGDIAGGMVLGLLNFASIVFIMNALKHTNIGGSMVDSSLVFGLNNIGVILLSVLVGKFLFIEKLNYTNYLGIILAVITIYLLYRAV